MPSNDGKAVGNPGGNSKPSGMQGGAGSPGGYVGVAFTSSPHPTNEPEARKNSPTAKQTFMKPTCGRGSYPWRGRGGTDHT